MKTDVAIVGAGPAGLSAAVFLAQKGLGVTVLDEYFIPGGRLLGQLFENPQKPPGERLWIGRDIAGKLKEKACHSGVKILTGTSVWNIAPGRRLYLSGAVSGEMEAGALLLATGAAERAVPVPGWTLPGVMSVGAAQVFTNLHRVRPGKRVAVVGIDPLAISVAGELKKAGAEVVGIYLPPPGVLTGRLGMPPEVIGSLSRSADMSPGALLKAAAGIFGGRYRDLGARLCGLSTMKIWGIPLHLRRAVVRIEGEDSVERVVTAGVSHCGRRQEECSAIDVDAVCISGGLYPLAELAFLAGCPLVDVPQLGGRVPLHGPAMETPRAGVFVAGNITGIEGAPVAMAQGTLAGAGIWSYLAKAGKAGEKELELAASRLEQAREEAPIKFFQEAPEGRKKIGLLWAGRKQDPEGGVPDGPQSYSVPL